MASVYGVGAHGYTRASKDLRAARRDGVLLGIARVSEGPASVAKDRSNGLKASETGQEVGTRVRLTKQLDFRDLVYRYPGAELRTLKHMSFPIAAGSKVGIVGSTGSGKTTTVDFILGLLRPSAGSALVDGREIEDAQLRPWQASIGYVPQTIFLADTSLARNIAFGVTKERIDLGRVEAVEESLPH